MTQLAPSWLPRQQRRHVDRALHKLLRRGVCSICGGTLRHNSPTASGFDTHGIVAVAGECCFDRLTQVFGFGLYSDRRYDFLEPHTPAPDEVSELPPERIVEAFETYAKAIAETDKLLADAERRGGGIRASTVILGDHPWKSDDKLWFERNPSRTHRMRMPFPDEIDEEAAETPAGYVLIILVRQVEPGSRLRSLLRLNADVPLPDVEPSAHALFEIAVGREAMPPDYGALLTLIQKYQASGAAS